MKKVIILIGMLILLVMTACSGSGEEEPAAANQDQSGNTVSSTQVIQSDVATLQPVQSEDTGSSTLLNESYTDALPVQTQLALGTILLEDGELAVDSDQAGELLPLWRVVQSLVESGTAAGSEITAVVNQIQDGMMAGQITAIVDMQLTQEAIRSLVQDGTIAIELGDVKGGAAGVAGGGALPGGAGGGPLGTQADPSQQTNDRATLGADGNDRFNQAIASALIQLLETK